MRKRVLGRGLSALMPDRSQAAGAKVVTLSIAEISTNRFQPRQQANPDKMDELIASIKEKGVIQPVLVRLSETGYELIAGERRLRAAQQLGFTQLPAIIRDVDDGEALQLSLIENIQREDLNALEEAQAYQQLVSEFGLTQEKIAQMVGKKSTTISNTLRLLKLPQEIQSALRQGMISMGHARAILAIKGFDEQDRILKRAIDQQLTVRELENLVSKSAKVSKRRKDAVSDPHLVNLQEQLQRILGTRVRIITGRKRGRIVIEYYSANDLERVTKLLKSVK